MKKLMQTVEDSAIGRAHTGRIRVLERLGTSVKDDISNPTPWKSTHCGRTTCRPCRAVEGSCKARGVVYKITCGTCAEGGVKSLYIGETHRTMFDRMAEHFDKLDSKHKDSALMKHWTTIHPEMNKAPSFIPKKMGAYFTSTERQIREALMMEGGGQI